MCVHVAYRKNAHTSITPLTPVSSCFLEGPARPLEHRATVLPGQECSEACEHGEGQWDWLPQLLTRHSEASHLGGAGILPPEEELVVRKGVTCHILLFQGSGKAWFPPSRGIISRAQGLERWISGEER